MKIMEYQGWANNLHLSNGVVELVITLDVGPRILRFGFEGGRNVFKEYDEQMGKSGEDEWMIRGGHRFWIAPEADYSYALDNVPVDYQEKGEGHVLLASPEDSENGWKKELEVKMDAKEAKVTVTHRLIATKDLAHSVAPWGLSVMAQNGTAVLPQPELGSHPEDLLPNRKLIVWPYTQMTDSRFTWGEKNFTVKQNPAMGPTKLGFLHQLKWAGYHLEDVLFGKTIDYVEGVHYPDMGVNYEVFSNEDMLEVESLAPLKKLTAGEVVEHIEHWELQKCGPTDFANTALPFA